MITLLISSYTHRYLHHLPIPFFLSQKDLTHAATLLQCCDAPKALKKSLTLITNELIPIHSLLTISFLLSILITTQTQPFLFIPIFFSFFLPIFQLIIASFHLFLVFQYFHFFFFQN